MTVLAGMAYGFMVACGALAGLHSADAWNLLFPSVAPPFTVGFGVLGIIYAREIEAHLRAGNAFASWDLSFAVVGMIPPFLFFPGLFYDWIGAAIFIPP